MKEIRIVNVMMLLLLLLLYNFPGCKNKSLYGKLNNEVKKDEKDS